MAVEVSSQILLQHPNGRIDLSALLDLHTLGSQALLCHDLTYGTFGTAERAFDSQEIMAPLNHQSIAILWGSVARAVDLIRKMPLGAPLRRVEDGSDSFKVYTEQLLSLSTDVTVSNVTRSPGLSSKSSRHVQASSETLEPTPEPLVWLDDTCEQRIEPGAGIGSQSELCSMASRGL